MKVTKNTYSVIIPVANRSEGLAITLAGLFRTETTEIPEVIVVNDGAWPSVSRVIREHPKRASIREIKLTQQGGPARARNKGVEQASGEWLVFLDDGIEVPPDWLKIAKPYTKRNDYLAFNVELRPLPNETDLERLFRVSSFNFKFSMKNEHFGGSGALMVNRKVFEKVGGFDVRLRAGEDVVFGKKSKAAGAKQKFLSELTVYHQPKTLRSILSDKVKYQRAAVLISKLYGHDFLKTATNTRNRQVLASRLIDYFANIKQHPLYKDFGRSTLRFIRSLLTFHALVLFLKVRVKLFKV